MKTFEIDGKTYTIESLGEFTFAAYDEDNICVAKSVTRLSKLPTNEQIEEMVNMEEKKLKAFVSSNISK